MSLDGFAEMWLVVMVTVPVAFLVSLVFVACCKTAQAADEKAEEHAPQESARRRALIEARGLAVAHAAIAETELMGKWGRDLDRAMLNHSYTVAAVQRIDALLEGDEEQVRHIESAQQALVNALRSLESRDESTVCGDGRQREVVLAMRGVDLGERYELSSDELAFDPWQDEPVEESCERGAPPRCRYCTRTLHAGELYFCVSCLDKPEHRDEKVRDLYRRLAA